MQIYANIYFTILLSDSDCIRNYCVQMFFSLYGFEDNFLKYIVGMIDYVEQYGSFYLYQQESRVPYSTNRQKNRVKELLPKGKKNHSMVYSNVKENTCGKTSSLQVYHSISDTRELLIKRNIHHKGQGNGLDTLL